MPMFDTIGKLISIFGHPFLHCLVRITHAILHDWNSFSQGSFVAEQLGDSACAIWYPCHHWSDLWMPRPWRKSCRRSRMACLLARFLQALAPRPWSRNSNNGCWLACVIFELLWFLTSSRHSLGFVQNILVVIVGNYPSGLVILPVGWPWQKRTQQVPKLFRDGIG